MSKELTTVGMDCGEVTLDNGNKLPINGTPGQKQFDFMWKILSRGALGLIILIDKINLNGKKAAFHINSALAAIF